MIEVKNMSKSFDSRTIIKDFNLTFDEGKIYGILGTNGAGKSTLLRTIAGIYKADSGTLLLDGSEIYENINAKSQIFYIPDENTFFPEKTIDKCIEFYKLVYKNFNTEIFEKLKELFKLETNRDIKSFSKGMKKQALLILSLSFLPKYLILDETFDGLDPLIRVKVKKFLIELVDEYGICLIISTHNITDIENLVEELIIINNQTVIVNDLTTDKYLKVQVAFPENFDINLLDLNVKSASALGSVHTIIVSNTNEEIQKVINPLNPLIFDVYPLTKEELFMLEVEGL